MIALEACGVTKIYSKNGRPLEVLNVERFSVREGELITVIGPSGCGVAPAALARASAPSRSSTCRPKWSRP